MLPYFFAVQFLAITSISAAISDKEYALMPSLFQIGNYDKCLMYGENYYYCVLKIQLKAIDQKNQSKTWRIIEEVISDRRNLRHDVLKVVVCVPEVCANISAGMYQDEPEVRRQLEEYYDKQYQHVGLKTNITVIKCDGQNKKHHFYNVYSLFFGIVVAVYGSVLIYATFYDIISSIRSKEKPEKLAETFIGKICSAISLRKNWQRLITVDTSAPDMQALRCLQGYRFYNMVYVIFFHGAASFLAKPFTNPNFIEQLSKKPAAIVYDVSYVMQIFFMLSGFMFSYQFLVEEEKGTKINLNYFIKSLVKRYIRLTPVLAFSIFSITSTWVSYISDGPLWHIIMEIIYTPCRENWWTHLLYINNIVNVDSMCFGHTWYLAVNVQLYILSFLLLCIISKYPTKSVHIFGAAFIGHIVCMFVLIYQNNNYHMLTRPLLGETVPRNIFADPTFQFLHLSLYTNSAGVLAGLVIGYTFFKYRNRKLFTQKWHVVLWWILSCGMPVTIILIDTWIDLNTPLYNASFGSTKKLIFALGNGLIVLGMTQGEGWLLRWVCETSFVYVLGRLTYCAYILHGLVLLIYAASDRGLTYVTPSGLLEKAAGDVAASFAIAAFATVFVEMPIIELHKWYTKKPDEKPKKVILREKDV